MTARKIETFMVNFVTFIFFLIILFTVVSVYFGIKIETYGRFETISVDSLFVIFLMVISWKVSKHLVKNMLSYIRDGNEEK